MILTREQVIENHRKMWNWIADETERLTRKVEKEEYFRAMDIYDIPENKCYCCEYNYNKIDCERTCIINWGKNVGCMSSYFIDWDNVTEDWKYASRLARIIANLPDNKNS